MRLLPQGPPEELKTAGTPLPSTPSGGRSREAIDRAVVVDEAWWLLGAGRDAGARFLQRLAKSARKHWCGLTTITQDVTDVLSTELGQAVDERRASGPSRAVAAGDGDSVGPSTCRQASRLPAHVRPGAGDPRGRNRAAALDVVASEAEHRLATSDPAEIAALGEDER